MTDSKLAKGASVNVAEIMRDIRARLSPTEFRRATYTAALDRMTVSLPDLHHLENLLNSVRAGASAVGSMPPRPNTFRARAGAVLVGVVRRILFWYTPQLHEFHLRVASALDEQMRVDRSLSDELREAHIQLRELKRKVEQIEAGKNAG